MSEWDGVERRSAPHCMHHSAVTQSLEAIANMKPVPFATFKWIIGIMVLIMLGFFVIPLSQMMENRDVLHAICVEQAEMNGHIANLQERLADWVQHQDSRIDHIEESIRYNHPRTVE